jgi:hypothetical protein
MNELLKLENVCSFGTRARKIVSARLVVFDVDELSERMPHFDERLHSLDHLVSSCR